jgi:hypothetical protein
MKGRGGGLVLLHHFPGGTEENHKNIGQYMQPPGRKVVL